MTLVTLPLEILSIIINYLDTKSLYNLYQSSEYFKNAIRYLDQIKQCQFSLNTLGTVQTLNSSFFRDISGNLKRLNLSGVHDLSLSSLLPALKELKKLIDLDISYTNIIMPDYLEIVKVRSTLKRLAINLFFGLKRYKITKNELLDYQQAFKGLESVHFIGSAHDLFNGKVAICILNRADLFNLKFTVFGNNYVYSDSDCNSVEVIKKLSQFRVHLLPNALDSTIFAVPIFKLLDLNHYEIIMLQSRTTMSVSTTPLLKEFICNNFAMEVDSLSDFNNLSESHSDVIGEAVVMLWNKASTRFNGKFFNKLSRILENYLSFHFDYCNLISVPKVYKWYCVHLSTKHLVNKDIDLESIPTNMQPIINLDCNRAFKEKTSFKLKMSFRESRVGQLSITKNNIFKNVTHLSLFGNVRYCPDFFRNLFECCDSLLTLEVIQSENFFCTHFLQYTSKSKGLQHILINVCEIDFFTLFIYLSDCKTLQNIHLINTTQPVQTLPNPKDLFSKCNNLYNVCIQSVMNNEIKEAMLELYKKTRSVLGKDSLNIDIFCSEGNPKGYDP